MKADIIAFVQEFFSSSIMPKGCNTSFIALIPKISNPLVVSDYRPISLIGAQYKIIAKLLANRLARVIDSVISCEQTAFVKHRQILDGPLMVNEVIKWCNRKRDKLMIFKIDFEKAFDSISWDYVLQIMKFMGFHGSWISWIRGCLNHATSSVLVNGSPTNEFHLSRGLRQGDPLSPFLFIIAMEGLHVAIEDAIAAGLYRVSGLKINFHKSNLVGVGVPFDEVKALAQLTESLRSKFFWGSNVDGNKIPWIAWNTALASKVHGGLGIGSLFSLNQALILKWRWRFFQNPNALWLNDLTAILDSVQFSDSEDSWIWSLGSPSFTVKCTRDHIDNCILPDDGSETIWNRYLPKKINIFLWRAVRDRLPSRWNLSRRGIELDSLTCPTCDSSVETSIHSLWLCSLAADIWNKVFAWLDLEVPPSSCIRDLFVWIGNMHVTSSKKDILTVICGVTLWDP
ncbi:RNA-directed DNA polymerase, eukaryota, reverse transcriptase zinc-binding domain protein [Tanacetum coccineum]